MYIIWAEMNDGSFKYLDKFHQWGNELDKHTKIFLHIQGLDEIIAECTTDDTKMVRAGVVTHAIVQTRNFKELARRVRPLR